MRVLTFGYCFLYFVSRLKWPLYGSEGSISAPATPGKVIPVASLFGPSVPTDSLLAPSTCANA